MGFIVVQGKLIDIHYDANGIVCGAYINTRKHVYIWSLFYDKLIILFILLTDLFVVLWTVLLEKVLNFGLLFLLLFYVSFDCFIAEWPLWPHLSNFVLLSSQGYLNLAVVKDRTISFTRCVPGLRLIWEVSGSNMIVYRLVHECWIHDE